jgi:hypothetical protein
VGNQPCPYYPPKIADWQWKTPATLPKTTFIEPAVEDGEDVPTVHPAPEPGGLADLRRSGKSMMERPVSTGRAVFTAVP